MSRIKKEDMVAVIAGKDRGKKGRVLLVFPKKEKILVEGVNVARKHTRRTREDQQGGIVSIERPLHISKVQYFCNRCNQAVRLGVKISPDGSRIRVCRRCKEELS